jgi:hypothetical protein
MDFLRYRYLARLPLSLFEAIAVGVPVVGTAVGGMPEVVSDGQIGSLGPSEDPQPLGRPRVHGHFSNDRMARQYCRYINANEFDISFPIFQAIV